MAKKNTIALIRTKKPEGFPILFQGGVATAELFSFSKRKHQSRWAGWGSEIEVKIDDYDRDSLKFSS